MATKLLPQPQLEAALGLVMITNAERIRSDSKSTAGQDGAGRDGRLKGSGAEQVREDGCVGMRLGGRQAGGKLALNGRRVGVGGSRQPTAPQLC